MDFKKLHKKYEELLLENNKLREEIERLKTQLGIIGSVYISGGVKIFIIFAFIFFIDNEITARST